MSARMQSVLAVIVSVMLAAVAQLVMKRGLESVGAVELGAGIGGKLLKMATSPRVVLGLAMYGVSTVFYLFALSREDLSFVYPLLALNFVFITLLSRIVLNEVLNPVRVAGILVISFGVSLIALKG